MMDYRPEQRERLRKAVRAIMNASVNGHLPSEEEVFDLVIAGSLAFRQGASLLTEEVQAIIAEEREDARLEMMEER